MLAQHDLQSPSLAAAQPAQTLAPATTAPAPLMVSESVKAGTYSYTGTYMPQSPCDSFGSGIRYSAANGGQVSILLITQPATTACAQAAGTSTGQPFSVSIKVKAGNAPAFDGVLLNGASIPAQLVKGM